jgi:hypothetical protein
VKLADFGLARSLSQVRFNTHMGPFAHGGKKFTTGGKFYHFSISEDF